jgi:hypothetical protein
MTNTDGVLGLQADVANVELAAPLPARGASILAQTLLKHLLFIRQQIPTSVSCCPVAAPVHPLARFRVHASLTRVKIAVAVAVLALHACLLFCASVRFPNSLICLTHKHQALRPAVQGA